MINDLLDAAGHTHNSKAMMASGHKSPERSPYELLGWAILEQAVDDLKLFCNYGLVTKDGTCLPWPASGYRRAVVRKNGRRVFKTERVRHSISGVRGPHTHKELVAWFKSDDAEAFCDLLGCRLMPKEIFRKTLENCAG